MLRFLLDDHRHYHNACVMGGDYDGVRYDVVEMPLKSIKKQMQPMDGLVVAVVRLVARNGVPWDVAAVELVVGAGRPYCRALVELLHRCHCQNCQQGAAIFCPSSMAHRIDSC